MFARARALLPRSFSMEFRMQGDELDVLDVANDTEATPRSEAKRICERGRKTRSVSCVLVSVDLGPNHVSQFLCLRGHVASSNVFMSVDQELRALRSSFPGSGRPWEVLGSPGKS